MRLLCLLVMGASGIVWEIEPHQEDDITPSPYILSFSKLNIILFLNHVYLLINLFLLQIFLRDKFNLFCRQNKCKMPVTFWATYQMNVWSSPTDFCSIPHSIVSPSVPLTTLLYCSYYSLFASIICAVFKTSHPGFMFPSNALWQAVWSVL